MDNSNPLLPHFERIHVRVVALWGSKDCREYLNTLLTATRNGTRSGFPPHIAKELFRLLHNHMVRQLNAIFAKFDSQSPGYTPEKHREHLAELSGLVGNWLNNHIAFEDTKYIPYVLEKQRASKV